jgi:hypothetical protein
MRNTNLRLLVIAAFIVLLPAFAQAQVSGCRTPETVDSLVRAYVREMASFNIPARDSLGLSGIDTTTIVFEADSTVCAQITQGIDSVFAKPASTSAYVVVRAGSRYFSFDPRQGPNGERGQLLHVVTVPFDYRRTITGF